MPLQIPASKLPLLAQTGNARNLHGKKAINLVLVGAGCEQEELSAKVSKQEEALRILTWQFTFSQSPRSLPSSTSGMCNGPWAHVLCSCLKWSS